MLRKLIVFAITSGLAKKAYAVYKARQSAATAAATAMPVKHVPPAPTRRRATTVTPTETGVTH